MHAEQRIDDAAVLLWSHPRGRRGVVERLGFCTHAISEGGVVELVQIVVKRGVGIAARVDHGRERLGTDYAQEEARGTHEDCDIMRCR